MKDFAERTNSLKSFFRYAKTNTTAALEATHIPRNIPSVFTFREFTIRDAHCAMKVSTDAVLLGAWAKVENAQHILDIGCGSGVITLMAAQRAPQAQLTGVEIDAAAARDARTNAEASPFARRVRIQHVDALKLTVAQGTYDHILSNPPYFEEDLLPPDSTRAAARHTAGGGLTFEALLRTVDTLLYRQCAEARFTLILPTQATAHFISLAAAHRLTPARRLDVITREGKPPRRTLLELTPNNQPLQTAQLVLTTPDNQRTAAYAALCKDFYL